MKIYGAGIAGLLAGCAFQEATIYEAAPKRKSTGHRALLRFRSPAVGASVGIPFRPVKVHKGIWSKGKFVSPSISLSNLYAKKVIGRLADRSIWNIEPADRWVAPEDFVERLIERCERRIVWERPLTAQDVHLNHRNGIQAISTMPMSALYKMMSSDPRIPVDMRPDKLFQEPEFKSNSIQVKRFRVPGADVFQTVYFPDPETSLYRASITGDLITAEFACMQMQANEFLDAFSLSEREIVPIDDTKQSIGKIASIDENWRKSFILWATQNLGIYSLGRFGTWRNILLDDVIKDIDVIKRLLHASDYDRFKRSAK